MPKTYPMAAAFSQCSKLLGLSEAQVLRRVGLTEDWLELPNNDVPADMVFKLWEAARLEARREDFELVLAKNYVQGPFNAAMFAFSCADTVALGLQRLSVFKQLIGPFTADLDRTDAGLRFAIRSSEPGFDISPSMQLFDVLYIVECMRNFTGEPVQPLEVVLPPEVAGNRPAIEYLGFAPKVGTTMQMTLSQAEADLPLITRSPALWDSLEPVLRRQMAEREARDLLSDRVRTVLGEALPAGVATSDQVARRLNMSKRSLQRRLTEEGTSFKEVLTQVRSDLARRYLRDSDLSVPEISHLLGFRENSSFFRAFQNWTGTTPGAYRGGDGS